MKPNSSRAFTLIELLIVISIIAILASILFPVFAQARSAARKTMCMSNFKQIGMAMLMYSGDWDERFARTQTSDNPGVPGYISWWSTAYYEQALNVYIEEGKGGVNSSGGQSDRRDVWWDPSDPDTSDPPMWGSIRNNGLITGTTRSLADITQPAHTIFMTLHVEHWKDYECENNGGPGSAACEPNPLPVNDPNNPFWFSDYFDICLNPWSYASLPTDAYYWQKGLASPPCELFPNDPTCIFEYQSIDGRCCAIPAGASGAASAGRWSLPTGDDFESFPPEHPRYGGHPFAFMDGHVKMMSFDATYVSPTDNMWATNQP